MLASILLTHHNLAFFLDTMRGVRHLSGLQVHPIPAGIHRDGQLGR